MNFNVEADAYDRYMGRWSAPLSSEFIEFARVPARANVLDVGCGPGALSAELARRLAPGLVRAVDPSPEFVAAARARHPGMDVREASAEALPFPDGSFDATLAQLVVHFMRDAVAGIAEMARVTREGGVVAACVWDFSHSRGPLGPFWDVARELDPSVEDESGLAGTRRGHLAEIFAAAGLLAVEETVLAVTREYDSFADWWEPFTLGVGPGGAYVARLEPGGASALRDACRSRLPEGPFTLSAHAWAVRGRPRKAPASGSAGTSS